MSESAPDPSDEDLARAFRQAADDHRSRSPVHASLCEAIADDPESLALMRLAPRTQRIPVLLLAAIHDSVLADPTCALAAWYPTVAGGGGGDRSGGTTRRNGTIEAALRTHLRIKRVEISHVLAHRPVQTNEVGRSAILLPALGMIAAEVGGLAMVDVGASAGLNLHLDRYRYHFRPGGTVGAPSPVELPIDCRGPVPVPSDVPPITARVGLDTSPVDLSDARDRRWLQACTFADQVERFERLGAAIDLALSSPLDLRAGDAVDDLPDVVREMAGHGHPVVVNTWCLGYLAADRRRDYVDRLDDLGRSVDLSWIFAESPAHAPGLPFDPRLTNRDVTALTLVRWRTGRRTATHLAITHPHGHWMHWAG